MTKPYFQVSVPTKNRSQPQWRGLHVFTGPAESGWEAVGNARAACEAALASQASGAGIPDRCPNGWGARGVRSDWILDWSAATAAYWEGESLFGRRMASARTVAEA